MPKRIQLVLNPTYGGSKKVKITQKGQTKLPGCFLRALKETNSYNVRIEPFQIIKDHHGNYFLAFGKVPFATLEPNRKARIEDLDLSGLDRKVYIATAHIKGYNPQSDGPDFVSVRPNAVIIYSVTDAQKMLHDPHFSDYGFPKSSYRVRKIDPQGRFCLSPLEHRIAYSNHGYTTVTGHPLYFFISLTKPS